MFKIFMGVAAAALTLCVAGVDPVQAQSRDSRESAAPQDGSTRARGSRQAPTTTSRRGRQPAAPTPEQAQAEAQALVTAAGNSCQVTEAVLMGQNEERQKVFEAACATGPGYFIVGSEPPALTDCVLLAGRAAVVRERNPEAPESETGTCNLPANQNTLAVITAYAREAGIRCEIDEAIASGTANDGAVIYEVGCVNEDGFWVRKPDNGAAVVTECLEIISQNGRCRYTTPAEQALSLKARLASSDASDCDVQQARYMGANANGRFYEVKCAVGDGYIARIGEEGVRQVYACAIAQPIGGGCVLTPTPAAAPAPTGGRA